MVSTRRICLAALVMAAAALLCSTFYISLPSLSDQAAEFAADHRRPLRYGRHIFERQSASQKDGRVAVCLVGGVRDFDLTGPSIQQHLLAAYPRTDVFLHAPLDETTSKLSLLHATPNLVALRVFPASSVNESAVPVSVLRVRDSPFGVQGLLHYFRLVEGCLGLIGAHERRHGFQYSWILRTRVDSYWSGPPPPLASLDPAKYTIAYGSDWGGYNDRFGIGGRAASQVALSRLSMLADLQRMNFSDLNSERTFKAQLEVARIPVVRANVSFCVLTRHRYAWITEHALPVASLTSTAPLNGAKCRPCVPRATGWEAAGLLRKYARSTDDRWIGPSVEGVDLCDASEEFEAGWERVFDHTVGPELARGRQRLATQTEEGCVEDMTKIQRQVEVWDSPPPEVLCRRRSLGRVQLVGSGEQLWPLFLDRLTGTAVMYSIGQNKTQQVDMWLRRKQPGMEVVVLERTSLDGATGWRRTSLEAAAMGRARSGGGGDAASAAEPILRYRPWHLVLQSEKLAPEDVKLRGLGGRPHRRGVLKGRKKRAARKGTTLRRGRKQATRRRMLSRSLEGASDRGQLGMGGSGKLRRGLSGKYGKGSEVQNSWEAATQACPIDGTGARQGIGEVGCRRGPETWTNATTGLRYEPLALPAGRRQQQQQQKQQQEPERLAQTFPRGAQGHVGGTTGGGPGWRVADLMQEWQHRKIELLKVDDPGLEYWHLRAWLLESNLQVCQLSVALANQGAAELHSRERILKMLAAADFHLNSCSRQRHWDSENCLFFSLRHCTSAPA